MMSRKRRASSISSKQDEDPLQMDDSTPEQSPVLQTSVRKKRRPDPSELCQQLYDSIRSIKKEDGASLCDTFIRAPKRRQEPSYYDIVTNPIDLLKIQQKLKTDSYDDIDDLMQDFELLVKNAKAFYKSDTVEHQDAQSLWQYILINKHRILDSNGIVEDEPKTKRLCRNPRRLTGSTSNNGSVEVDNESTRPDEDINPYEELFAVVMNAVDATMNDRPLHRMFLLLPSKKMYPDYYDVIEHPIDLRLIATKIQMNAYSNLVEMERDLLQMTKNACQFNEPGSQIYKDAKTLKRLFTQRRMEIDSGKIKASRRVKTLSSAAISAMKEEVDSSDDEETSKKGEGPMWALFDHLYNAPGSSEHPGATGPPLGTSLWKLPVRRFHPEYFELIKYPISMCQIHTKLKKGDYANISDLTADLCLMLDNAKKAFPSTHRTHKDAVKMLKIMNTKLVEESLEPETSDMDDDGDIDGDVEDTLLNNRDTPREKKKGRPRINSNNTSAPNTPISNSPKASRIPINAVIKKKILSIQRYLVDFTIGNRKPIDLFMEKPPRKVYPDYYDIIQNPIDMNTIEHNIRCDKYATVEDVVADYRLMFSNCRQYNEEGSTIYEDANNLERALNEKLREFPGLADIKKPPQKLGKPSGRRKTVVVDKLWQFYETIREYQEPKGKRQLSLIFTKLPSKNEYPDYYDIIKEPIDMERIAQKLKQACYESVDELAADFLLMLENACKYNEPDSQIYKDALVLQQLTLQLKQSLKNEQSSTPDVSLAVQELFLSLFTQLYNHQDEAGRCYSDSLAEVPEYDEIADGTGKMSKIRGISLDLIKRRLDKLTYKRLDVFQEDIFSCLERARRLSRTDSDVFQDSIELQMFFIKKRDELCKDTFSSPALLYTVENLLAEVEVMRQQKVAQEDQDQEDKDDLDTAAMQGESMTINQKVFSPGDFVYFQLPENKIPSIAYIERLWTTADNVKWMHGSVFLRPHETYHVTTRKFLEMEVFKSSVSQTIPMDKVLGKCYIMHIKDYIKMRPEGYADKDVFVCESRYNGRARCFKKFKIWPFVRENDPVRFVPRDEPLELKRVMSVFKERIEKHKGELEELKLQEALVEKEKPNVVCDALPLNSEPNSVYYQQFNTICSGAVKIGDFVYVATQSGKQSIAQIHQIWENGSKSYFKGPWLLTPSEIVSPSNKQYYRQELLLSTVEDISPLIAIVGRCAVLEYTDYISSRPTEIPECDVYICESVYDELRKSLRKLNTPGGLRKFQHSPEVTQDEIFHFKTHLKPIRDVKGAEAQENLALMEDSLDGNPPSVNSDIAAISSPAPSVSSTPISSKVKNKTTKKSLTGYILYSSEVRKGISQSNPDASFGDISRMVGTEWKNLPASVKQSWEDRASRLNEESAARREIDESLNCAGGAVSGSPGPNDQQNGHIFECLWDKCDYQFEDAVDCMEHCIQDGTGHIQRTAMQGNATAFTCLWRGCIRMKKNMQAFPSMLRLIKHVREVHLSKGGKILLPNERSKNFVPRKNQKTTQVIQLNTQSHQVQQAVMSPRGVTGNGVENGAVSQYPMQVLGPPPEPMFVTVPPRPQRVLHSEAYIKYIENLQNTSTAPQKPTWKTAVKIATPSNVTTKPGTALPTNWLGRYAEGTTEDVVTALCHLRNFMMDDALQIKRSCY
ncbi:protein polybromo-1 [Bactrocera dorsalis]|uniref:Protein polybromo-1 n=1 Tax=Bactrocera dorsalis TaxID=27457 RepID=A0A6I9UW09_BACDO|nr:protein polybromo-1 [Bactrocera dorsalis]